MDVLAHQALLASEAPTMSRDMTHEERNTIVALITNPVINGLLAWRLWSLHGRGAFSEPDALATWAQNVLLAIPAAIVLAIVLTIVFNIVFAIATRTSDPSLVVDERDKAFGVRAMMTNIAVAAGGFILSIVALAFGWEALVVFNLIYAAFALGDLSGNVAKLVLYRRGI
jgi:hypothetical protein